MGGMGQRVLQPDCWDQAGETAEPSLRAVRNDRLADAQSRSAGLAKAIDVEVIPRLVLARRAAPVAASVDEMRSTSRINPDDIARFARTVIERDLPEAAGDVATLRAQGASLEAVFLELLAPTARSLGEMWDEDLCDFTQVTVGLWRLQQIVRELSPVFCDVADPLDQSRRALLVPAHGEQHTFGLLMVAEFFRRAAWDVCAAPLESGAELLQLVRHEWFAVVGISVSADTRLEGLAAMIHSIRRASRNRGVGIMVGGSVFIERPDLAALVGADASGVDGRQAALQAESLLALAARRA